MNFRPKRISRPLQLLQINVCRGASSYELASSFAYERKIDIILIQEPYIFHDRQRRITKRISSYECFSPNDNWSSKPRALTYVRKGAGLQARQPRLIPDGLAERDILFLEVTDISGHNLLVITCTMLQLAL